MTTPDYPDWTASVAVLDQANVLYGVPTASITPGGGNVVVDTSRSQSVHVALTPPPAAAVGNRYLVQCRWIESGREVGRETLSLHSGTSYSGTNALFWQLPVYGSQLSLSAVGDDASVINAVVIGSTREIPAQRLSRAGLTIGRCILDTGAVNILAGTAQTFRIPPVERAITWGSSWAIAAGSVDLRGVFNTQALGMTTSRLDLVLNPPGQVLHPGVEVPLMGMEFVITNNDAANHTGSLFVWDVS